MQRNVISQCSFGLSSSDTSPPRTVQYDENGNIVNSQFHSLVAIVDIERDGANENDVEVCGENQEMRSLQLHEESHGGTTIQAVNCLTSSRWPVHPIFVKTSSIGHARGFSSIQAGTRVNPVRNALIAFERTTNYNNQMDRLKQKKKATKKLVCAKKYWKNQAKVLLFF